MGIVEVRFRGIAYWFDIVVVASLTRVHKGLDRLQRTFFGQDGSWNQTMCTLYPVRALRLGRFVLKYIIGSWQS